LRVKEGKGRKQTFTKNGEHKAERTTRAAKKKVSGQEKVEGKGSREPENELKKGKGPRTIAKGMKGPCRGWVQNADVR